LADGILLVTSRLNRILDIDYENRCAVVQPGVTNLAVSQAMAQHGFYYAPDPSSQIACSIGGNVAENAGGVHCLKYGTTSPNLLGVELVLQGTAVFKLEDVVLDVEYRDLVDELERLGHDAGELVLGRHATRILRVYTGTVYNHAAPEACA
jgi:glycolate oxidase